MSKSRAKRSPAREPWKRPLARRHRRTPRAGAAARADANCSLPSAANSARPAGTICSSRPAAGIVASTAASCACQPTPAMTLIDVDGYLDPRRACGARRGGGSEAIRRLDIGGSIGIDLPTVRRARRRARRRPRRSTSILPQPFERTAVNGFGFLQIVRPRGRASLIELAQDRAAFEARALLRRAAFERPGRSASSRIRR